MLFSVREQIVEEIELLLKSVCLSRGASYTYNYYRGYPPVENHADETNFIAEIARTIPTVENVITCPPFMIGEDFAYYMQHVPGTFFFTGAKDPLWEQAYPHHHAKFNFDERAMLIAAKVLGKATIEFLKEK